ncbi:MurR/RpiR family transcriptional regulator [Enterococcus sp. JM9B]|uniref:MurR/RpiR family transcriptional regulator n=1 Tax=Enterococcus sp. JM9B TaxID=1857216 RepID=UPI001374AD61|nr:MurR/RpiR family transcriptional regulator [Enterococcus sp. JM9B]KAF1301858.1 RpiR family transcriptional regulator [Enterococcus sp. JM9B]
MGLLIENYGNKLSELSEAERSAFYELDNTPELISRLNLTALAQKIASSNSTIIRLSQRLGFQGFSQFKYEINRLLTQTVYIKEKDLLLQYQNFFSHSLTLITLENLEYFAKKIQEANNLFLVGVGLTKPIAEYMSKRLYQLNRPSMYIYESHMLDLLPQLLKSDDLVIFVSMSGETQSLLVSARKVRQKGNTILSITNSPNNSLNNLTNRNINSNIPTNVFHNYDITSRAFLMVHVDLILEIFLKRYSDHEK